MNEYAVGLLVHSVFCFYHEICKFFRIDRNFMERGKR